MDKRAPVEQITPVATDTASAKDVESLAKVTPKQSTIDDCWAWEIVGVVGSVLAFSGMAGYPIAFDNHALPTWSAAYSDSSKQWTITLNSILSILSTLANIFVLIPVTKGLGQPKWVWFA